MTIEELIKNKKGEVDKPEQQPGLSKKNYEY